MKFRIAISRVCLSFLSVISLGATAAQTQTPPEVSYPFLPSDPAQRTLAASAAMNYGRLPLNFESNRGQTDPQVRFVSRGDGYSLFLTDSAAVLALTKPHLSHKPSGGTPQKSVTDVVRMELAGSVPTMGVTGVSQLPGSANYFIGSDPAQWHVNVPTFAKVKYAGVYPGVDLVFYGSQQQLEYDFIVAPWADAKPARLHFAGARRIRLNGDGDLIVESANGNMAFHKPVVYQQVDGRRRVIAGSFTLLADNTVGFSVAGYDHSRELIIDPVLAYSTYLGGTGADTAVGIAVDPSGNAYVAGNAASVDFPITGGSFQSSDSRPVRPFVAKFNAAGTALVYSTYLGGSGNWLDSDTANAIAVDAAGDAYITGMAYSTDFPVTSGAFQHINNGVNAFVTKLNPSGSALLYSTYLGGSGSSYGGESPTGIAVDVLGAAYVTGSTMSHDFPVTGGAFQLVNKAPASYGYTTFLTKLNPGGSALGYSTYLGGSLSDSATAIALDASGSAYLTGAAASSDFPVTGGCFQPLRTTVGPGNSGFVSKLNPSGSALSYSTYLGGTVGDKPLSIAVDTHGDAYVGGKTFSDDFPVTALAFQKAKNPGGTGFVSELSPSGSALIYSTYLGGLYVADSESVTGIAVDSQGHAFATGFTYSPDFPVTVGAFQTMNEAAAVNAQSAFVTELNIAGSALVRSTLLGGSGRFDSAIESGEGDAAVGIVVDSLQNVYLAGNAHSFNFPVVASAFQVANRSVSQDVAQQQNVFVSKFAFHGSTTTSLVSDGNSRKPGESITFTAQVTPDSGKATPVGNVSFLVDGTLAGSAAVSAAGYTTYQTSSLAPGQHRVIASYLGQPKVFSASSTALAETIVNQAATPVFQPLGGASLATAGIYRSSQMVTLTTVTPGATIHYTTDGTLPTASSSLYSSPIAVSSSATISAVALASGESASAVETEIYEILPTAPVTATTLQSSANPSILGQPVTFTATVTVQAQSPGTVPIGTVVFRHGSVVIGAASLQSGVATITTSALTLLGHDLTATYIGNASTGAASHSPVLRQIVNP